MIRPDCVLLLAVLDAPSTMAQCYAPGCVPPTVEVSPPATACAAAKVTWEYRKESLSPPAGV